MHLEIEKHVPIAGGMGGGSADAAATLVACDALWGTELGKEELHALAAKLGADVPFALTGGTAIGTGRGDQLSPALATGSFHWVLAVAEFGLSTPGVYRELDRHRDADPALGPASSTPRQVDADVLQALRAGDARLLADALHNDLQAAALRLAPGLGGILELGEANGALAGIVSGSGPTVAFLADDADSALELQVALSASRLTRGARARPGARRTSHARLTSPPASCPSPPPSSSSSSSDPPAPPTPRLLLVLRLSCAPRRDREDAESAVRPPEARVRHPLDAPIRWHVENSSVRGAGPDMLRHVRQPRPLPAQLACSPGRSACVRRLHRGVGERRLAAPDLAATVPRRCVCVRRCGIRPGLRA